MTIGLVQMWAHQKKMFNQQLIGFYSNKLFFCKLFDVFRIFLTSTLNFSFWTADQTETYVKVYKNKTYHGYEALCVAINQAIDVKTTTSMF